MIAGLGVLILANAAALLGAWAVLERFRCGDGPVDLLLLLVLRLGIVSATVLLAGVTGTLSAMPLGIVSGAAIAALAAGGLLRRATASLRRPEGVRFAGAIAALVAARLLLQVWFFAPHLGDATSYHLPKIGEWMRAGGFTREMGLHPHAAFPAGFELVEAWWTVFLRHDVLLEMAGVEFVALGAAALRVLARWAGLGPGGTAVATLGFALSPGFHLGATSGLNDTAAAALVVTAMALLAVRAGAPLLVLVAGLGAGVKPTFGFAVPGMILLWGLLRREGPPAIRPGRIPGMLLLAIGLAAGLFWYGRNWIWYGNPFHPLGSPGVFNPSAVQLGPSATSWVRNLADLAVRVGDGRAAYGPNVDEIAGWGPLAVALGLPGILAGAATDHRLRRLGAAFGTSLLSSLLFVQNDPWCLKYVFYVPAILAVGAGWLWERCAPTRPAALAALAFSFLGTFLSYDLPIEDALRLAGQPWRTRTALRLREPELPVGRVGCMGGYRAEAYLLYDAGFEREVVYLRPRSVDELAEELARRDLRVVYAAPVQPEEQLLLDRCVARRILKPLGGRLYGVNRN